MEAHEEVPPAEQTALSAALGAYLVFVESTQLWNLAPTPFSVYAELLDGIADETARVQAYLSASSIIRESGAIEKALAILLRSEHLLPGLPATIVALFHAAMANMYRELDAGATTSPGSGEGKGPATAEVLAELVTRAQTAALNGAPHLAYQAGVISGASGTAVTLIITELWNALRRNRARRMQELRSVVMTVRVESEYGQMETTLDVRGDGREGARQLEVEMAAAHQGDARRIMIRLSAD